MKPAQVAEGVFRLALPLGIHSIPSVNAYLFTDPAGDTLVDCGIYAEAPLSAGQMGAGQMGAGQVQDGTGALGAALAQCGRSFGTLGRLIITHAHIDHFGIAGEVVRRSGADLLMHAQTDLDRAKYAHPDRAVDRRALMLADHGLYGDTLAGASAGLREWMPVMPSIGQPTVKVHGGEKFRASGRTWEILHTPGHSPGHICLWSADDQLLCSGDHLLKSISPPVTFERGFERDPMGSYLESLRQIEELRPALVLPGHGEFFTDGAARAAEIAEGKRRRLGRVLAAIQRAGRTVTQLTEELFPRPVKGPQLHFVMAEMLAYLAYLEVRGQAERVRAAAGVFVWHALPGGGGTTPAGHLGGSVERPLRGSGSCQQDAGGRDGADQNALHHSTRSPAA
jgi:glyoxylase-like metal-dependent hydrolase (beta-lactamase superfamily II)